MNDRPSVLLERRALIVTALILAATASQGAGPVNSPPAPVAATGSASPSADAWPEPLRLRRILEAAGPGSLMPENGIVAGIHLGTNTVCHVQDLGHEGRTFYVGQLDEAATVRWHVAREVQKGRLAGRNASVAVAGSTLWYLWEYVETSGLFLSMSPDLGRTWADAKPVPVPPQRATPAYTEPLAMCASGQSVHILYTRYGWNSWFGPVGFGDYVFYARSDDGGATWSRATTMDSSGGVHGAVIACDGENILVAWGWAKPKDNGLAYCCSADNGRTWSRSRRIRVNSPGGFGCPSAAVRRGQGFLCWHAGWIDGQDIPRIPEEAWSGTAHSRYHAAVVNLRTARGREEKLYEGQAPYGWSMNQPARLGGTDSGTQTPAPLPAARQTNDFLSGGAALVLGPLHAYVLAGDAFWQTGYDAVRWEGPIRRGTTDVGRER